MTEKLPCLYTAATIHFSPLIEEGPVTTNLDFYSYLSLTCLASGNPQPSIQWYKDESEIGGEGSPFLIIEETVLTDRGVYRCTATNLLGVEVSKVAYINING